MKQSMNFVINLCNFIRSLVILNIRIIPFKVGISDCGRFSFQRLEHPIVLSGLILTFIGLLIGLLIILIKKLHSTSIRNSIFMVITLIIMIIGVGLLNSPTKCLAILLGVKLQVEERKLKIVLFSMWGGTSQLYCTWCSLDLLVVCNVNCDCIHSILLG
ncbi:unnamed protein product [Schistosoma intercalatum]|nr:unnamed protein product [Schistosoma intercalatum]